MAWGVPVHSEYSEYKVKTLSSVLGRMRKGGGAGAR